MEIRKALKIIIDSVERYNKQDEDKEVAEAAGVLESLIEGERRDWSCGKCTQEEHIEFAFGEIVLEHSPHCPKRKSSEEVREDRVCYKGTAKCRAGGFHAVCIPLELGEEVKEESKYELPEPLLLRIGENGKCIDLENEVVMNRGMILRIIDYLRK